MNHTWALSHGFKHSSRYTKFILDYVVKTQNSITLSRNHINPIIYVISHNVYNSQLTCGDQCLFSIFTIVPHNCNHTYKPSHNT